jgi:hypothetical protein
VTHGTPVSAAATLGWPAPTSHCRCVAVFKPPSLDYSQSVHENSAILARRTRAAQTEAYTD